MTGSLICTVCTIMYTCAMPRSIKHMSLYYTCFDNTTFLLYCKYTCVLFTKSAHVSQQCQSNTCYLPHMFSTNNTYVNMHMCSTHESQQCHVDTCDQIIASETCVPCCKHWKNMSQPSKTCVFEWTRVFLRKHMFLCIFETRVIVFISMRAYMKHV